MINIMSEGFVVKYKLKNRNGICYTKRYERHPRGYKDHYIDVLYIPSINLVIITEGCDETPFEDWSVLFRGWIFNIDEFRKVLDMVIIH